MLNIAGYKAIDDPEYRYKMPRLVGKIEGRGNGIKTVVVNCSDLALSLHRSPAEVTKFFGCELGAQSKYDIESERSVVNGAFDNGTMQQHLSKYIENFVLCPACRLPETKYKFRNQCIFHRCLACGAEEPIDMNHKLTTFILKERAAMKRTKSKGEDKKKKRREKKLHGEQPVEKKEKDKKKKDKKKKKKSKNDENDDDHDDLPEAENVTWHTDLSEEAVKARMAEAEAIEDAARSAMAPPPPTDTVSHDDENDIVATLDNLQVNDKAAIETASQAVSALLTTKSPSITEIIEEVEMQQTYSALPVSHRLSVFFHAAFDADILNQIEKYGPVLEHFVKSVEDQYQLISLAEHFCGVKCVALATSFPVILKVIYDLDILTEDVIIHYAENTATIRTTYLSSELSSDQAEALLQSLAPFLEWLKNAEEESDDEESD